MTRILADFPKTSYRDKSNCIPCEHIPGVGIVANCGESQVLIQVADCSGRVDEETQFNLEVATHKDGACFLRRCVQCENRFISRGHAATLCSEQCRVLRSKQTRKNPAIRLRTTCDWCRQSMTADRASKRYCGDQCRQAAHRKYQ